jgi:hypothetical protein
MIFTSITRDGNEHVVTTPITIAYNGGGSGGRNVNHELIP